MSVITSFFFTHGMTSHFIVAGFNYLWNRGYIAFVRLYINRFYHCMLMLRRMRVNLFCICFCICFCITASSFEKFRTSSFADTENNKLEHNPQTRVNKPA